MNYNPSEFNTIPFDNRAKQTLRQIYAVLYFMKEGLNHRQAINKAVKYFQVHDSQTIQDKCDRKFAGDIPTFVDWYKNGKILSELAKKKNLNEHDKKLFEELLAINNISSQPSLKSDISQKQGTGFGIPETSTHIESFQPSSKPDILQNKGAGFGTPETNAQVESCAVEYATKRYNSDGWKVISVENQKCGFDLICIKDGDEANVEVKGVSGRSCSFIITAGEYKQAKMNPNFFICVVTNVLIKPVAFIYPGKEFIEKFSIEPIQYKAELKA